MNERKRVLQYIYKQRCLFPVSINTMSEEQFSLLRSCIIERPPYSGTFTVPEDSLVLFYGKDNAARRIDFLKTSEKELEHLAQTCDAATFGVDQKDVLDESYRKAGKLDAAHFAIKFDPARLGLIDAIRTDLLEGHEARRSVYAELYKLNVYGKDSFFKAHQDTPRGESMFASLVVVFPTFHEGGSLLLRQEGKEWTFDSAQLLSKQTEPCVAFTAFYSDVEHEVTLVESGYRVTVTYNLYLEDSSTSSSSLAHPLDTSAVALKSTFKRLLDDPSFLPEGGHLGFELRHRYPVNVDDLTSQRKGKAALKAMVKYLKGSDAILLQVCNELSIGASLRVVFKDDVLDDEDWIEDTIRVGTVPTRPILVMLDRLVNLEDSMLDIPFWQALCEYYGGQLLSQTRYRKQDMVVDWVTEAPEWYLKASFLAYGNEPSVDYRYANLCLLVDVGAVGKRETA
ncbi:hypothetical protein AcV5_008111 [Taiwanofungus camphoratus]|nr:hypothetical protein AcV5_008111 [Antrodia cinnamomea]